MPFPNIIRKAVVETKSKKIDFLLLFKSKITFDWANFGPAPISASEIYQGNDFPNGTPGLWYKA